MSGPTKASDRIAFGTLARSVGELVSKPASLIFFVVIARELGQERFGDFIFGLSFSTVLLVLAGIGMQELIAREIARDRRRVDELLWNVVVLKSLMLLILLMVIAIAVTALGYSSESTVAILIISVGVGLEYQVSTISAVFQAYERQQHIATSLVVTRISTLVLGVTIVLAGGGLVAAAIAYAIGSVLGLGTAYVLMRRFVVRPRREVDPSGWRALLRTSLPLGGMSILSTLSLRSSVVILGFLAAGTAAVGEYGAAFRLIETTLFVSWSFSSAILPWFSRHPGSGQVASLARGFEMSLKAVIAAMMPLALILALFADPLIEFLFGPDYEGAVTPLRVLAGMTVLWGVNGVVSVVLIGRNRPGAYVVPAVVTIVQVVVLSAILIPPHGATGAAVVAVSSAAVLAVLSTIATARLIGAVSPLRIAIAPVIGGALMALVAVLLSDAPWPLAAGASIVVYGAAFLAFERTFLPADFAYYSGLMRLRRPGTAPT